MPALLQRMNGVPRRLYLNHTAILGGIVIFTALSCDLNNPLSQDAGTSKDAGAGPDSGHTCLPLGGACQKCPNGYLTDANGCATCQCKPPTTCGPVCDIYCAYGNVPDAQGCPTCACNPPPSDSCTVADCGPVPPIVPQICPDGTVAGVTCLRDKTGVCGWSGLTCPPPPPPPPPPTCTADQCPSPRPAGPNALCPDGKTVSGPACLPTANGSCGWTQVTCPPTCVDNVLCIQGDHWDSTLCKCVPNSPCPCAGDQLCVTQIGGPAISDPPPTHCEAPDATCLQHVKMGGVVVSPCVCLAASDGNCTQSSSAGNCTCDNGIR